MKILIAAALTLLASQGRAAETPRYLPRHDAAITYRSEGSDALMPQSLTIRYFAAAEKLRIEGGALGYLLVDRPMERIELVMPQPKLVLEMPPGGGITQGFILSGQFQFERIGSDHILGRACTIYSVTAPRAHGQVCLTADGLLLRGEGQGRDGRRARIEAVSVSSNAQPAGLFTPPDSYRIMPLLK
jgi:hypothetical protein